MYLILCRNLNDINNLKTSNKNDLYFLYLNAPRRMTITPEQKEDNR